MKIWKTDFNSTNKNHTYYDLFEDYDLIESSFAQQYGIRLRYEENMPWSEFISLLSGLGADTPLGKIVTIRAETDSEVIKNFTAEQKKINREWQEKEALTMSKEDYISAMKQISLQLKQMSKEGGTK